MNAVKEEEKGSIDKSNINDKTKETIKNNEEYIKKASSTKVTTDNRNESKSSSVKTNDNTKLQENEDNNVDNLKNIYCDLQDQVQKMKISMENKANDDMLRNYIKSLQNDIDNKININKDNPLLTLSNNVITKPQIINKKEISKEMYFKLRRDYELLKILYEKQQAEHEAILSESRQVFEGQLNILESKILYLQNNLGNNNIFIILRSIISCCIFNIFY